MLCVSAKVKKSAAAAAAPAVFVEAFPSPLAKVNPPEIFQADASGE